MRVLHVISGIRRSQGGPTVVLEGLAAAQLAIGMRPTVVATYIVDEGRDDARFFRERGIDTHVYGPAHGKFSRLRGLSQIIAGHVRQADVVHIHAMWEEIQHVAAVECRRAGVPYAWHACNAISWPIMQKSYWSKRAVLAWRVKRDLNHAGAIHYATANERDESEWLGLRSPAIVEPHGVDLSGGDGDAARFRSAFPGVRGERILLFVGRLNEEKGLDVLIPAFARARRPGWSLVLVGSDPDRPYRHVVERMVHDNGLAEHVMLTGHLNGQAKADAYAAADLFVLPSRSENFGAVVVEALSAGVPTVVTAGVGLAADVLAMGVGGVAAYDVDSLVDVLAEWMSDDARRERIRPIARASVRERYDWTAIAARWKSHYARMLQRAGRAVQG